MNSLVSILTRIYIFVFGVSFMVFLVQAFAAPVSTRLAIGIGLHGVLMVFGGENGVRSKLFDPAFLESGYSPTSTSNFIATRASQSCAGACFTLETRAFTCS